MPSAKASPTVSTSAASDAAPMSAETPMLAVFFDGVSNRKHRVALSPGERLEIVEEGILLDAWAYTDILGADGDMALRLTSLSAPLARLDIADPGTAERLKRFLPPIDQLREKRQTGRIVGWSLAAAGSIALMILYGIPFLAQRMTPLIPPAYEKRLGEAVDRQFLTLTGAKPCAGAAGVQALAKMMEKIGGGRPVNAQVLSIGVANAVALPGDKIYLFEGMLAQAKNVDEVAGVMAHELGHAHSRDGMRSLLQTGGTSYLLGLLFGDISGSGAIIFATQTLLNASHSREAELAADDFAIASMTRLGRSPVPMGEFLQRLTGDRTATIIDSHPVSSARLDRFRRSVVPTAGPEILTDAEWRALKDICESGAN